jgi:NAD(P)-dependent dehydrogenase (short-subunit alcohol dehydrogenase family)
MPSLNGKLAIVTGAKSVKPSGIDGEKSIKLTQYTSPSSRDGIGYHVAYQLVLKGARVYVGARSQEKANTAIKNMLEDNQSIDAALLKPLIMDLCDFQSVQRAARGILESEERLDILVNNAAVLPGPVSFEANGISVSFATNHLGPFLFTTELMPLLTATAKLGPENDVRVVNVGSTAHYDAPASARFGSLNDFNNLFGSPDNPMTAYWHYGYTKCEC